MRRRLSDHLRCADCRMHHTLCICALRPRLETRTHLLLILHQLELSKPTNTGRLAVSCLPHSSICVRGRVGGRNAPAAPDEVPSLPPDSQPVLLFPHEDAVPIATFADSPLPVTLIVPDGTWPQAIKVRRRLPWLEGVPAARLPDERVSNYQLRHDGRPGHLSTLEAIACALGVLEGERGPATERALLDIQRIMVERTLWTKGRIATGDVQGGIPPGLHFNGKEGSPAKTPPT